MEVIFPPKRRLTYRLQWLLHILEEGNIQASWKVSQNNSSCIPYLRMRYSLSCSVQVCIHGMCGEIALLRVHLSVSRQH
jgi:hypothetical protein